MEVPIKFQNQHAIIMLSTCYQHAINLLSICYQIAINILSICYQFAINMLSICYQYAIIIVVVIVIIIIIIIIMMLISSSSSSSSSKFLVTSVLQILLEVTLSAFPVGRPHRTAAECAAAPPPRAAPSSCSAAPPACCAAPAPWRPQHGAPGGAKGWPWQGMPMVKWCVDLWISMDLWWETETNWLELPGNVGTGWYWDKSDVTLISCETSCLLIPGIKWAPAPLSIHDHPHIQLMRRSVLCYVWAQILMLLMRQSQLITVVFWTIVCTYYMLHL